MPTHAERRFLPYRPEQLYALVADVERYPEFLPWCTACRITSRNGHVITADLIIGFKMIRERFTSRVTLSPEERIDVEYTSGPLRYLNNHWRFEPAPGGCVIDFHIDFEFKSRLFQRLAGVVFNEAVRRMVAAFEARAKVLYRPIPASAGRSPLPDTVSGD
ncbi:MAG: type II toxin-antitoxin system RatA family toxin [Alphaproteobacteria bacterium]|nr:type II toxin-antitoxin system RatA family toxin [Alphaproteobacteria bacterium]MCB9930701.1 type II toxin-antitoxin system RatA family toxin [Alphaproteobacteria bacterium]